MRHAASTLAIETSRIGSARPDRHDAAHLHRSAERISAPQTRVATWSRSFKTSMPIH